MFQIFVKMTGGSHTLQIIHLLYQTAYNFYAVKHNFIIFITILLQDGIFQSPEYLS